MTALPKQLMLGLAYAVQALTIVGCEENCYTGPRVDRCEGDVRVYCPGGWLRSAPFRPERDDCGKRKQRCVGLFPENYTTMCMAPLGTCKAEGFVSRCHPYSPNSATGSMTTCINGEELANGDSCELKPTLSPDGGRSQ